MGAFWLVSHTLHKNDVPEQGKRPIILIVTRRTYVRGALSFSRVTLVCQLHRPPNSYCSPVAHKNELTSSVSHELISSSPKKLFD